MFQEIWVIFLTLWNICWRWITSLKQGSSSKLNLVYLTAYYLEEKRSLAIKEEDLVQRESIHNHTETSTKSSVY